MLAFDNSLTGGHSVDRSRLFSKVHSDMMGDKEHKLWHGKFWLDINKNIYATRVIKH